MQAGQAALPGPTLHPHPPPRLNLTACLLAGSAKKQQSSLGYKEGIADLKDHAGLESTGSL